jgi:CAAX protease family protein
MPPHRQLRTTAQNHPLATFFALAFGLGWLLALPLALSPAGLGWLPLQLPDEWLILFAVHPPSPP